MSDWSDSDNGGSEDESGGLAARRKMMEAAKQQVAGSATHDICPTCKKEVYLTADRLAYGGRFYHLPCFKCVKCGETIRGGKHLENDGKPYCQSCFGKYVRPKGYGFGGGQGTLSSEK